MTARDLAIRVLVRVERAGAWASRALDAELCRARISSEERALATEIVYGVLRQRARLDRALARLAPHGLSRLDAETRATLRAGAYQILLLHRVPDFAAVDAAVGRVRATRGARLAGFANAVLRRLAAEREPAPTPVEQDPVAHLVEAESMPPWLALRLVADLGADGVALGRALNARAPVGLRANRMRIDRDELIEILGAEFPDATLRRGELSPDAVVATGLAAPHRTRAHARGLYAVQDEAAQLAAPLVGASPGERVLDACAGVGTKSTHLAALMDNRGRVDAIDTNAAKVAAAREAARRLGTTIVRAARANLLDWPEGDYDAVLIDAPCSGLGVLRRHPEAKWRVGAADVARLATMQARLLEGAAARVRPRGALVYAVCTFTREETSEVVARFLAARADFAIDARAGGAAFDRVREADGSACTWTHRFGTDTFYAARFVRREHA